MRNIVIEVWIVVCSGMLQLFEPEMTELNEADKSLLEHKLAAINNRRQEIENSYHRV